MIMKQTEKMATTNRQSQQWAEMFKNLADVLSTLANVYNTETDRMPAENVYLRPDKDEQRLRQMVKEALEESSRFGIGHLMRYKYQWYALYRELEQRGWIGRGHHGLSHFCRQMNRWFPDVRVTFDYKGVAKGGEHRHDPAYEAAEHWFRERL